MKLLFIIPSLQSGGMERVMSQLLNEIAKNNNLELHLILYGIRREIFYDIPESIIIHRPSFRFNNSYRFFFTLKTLFFLRKETKKINPDTILSFGEMWNNLVLLSLLKLRYPVYVSDRGKPGKSLGIIHDQLRKILYPMASGVIAQTKHAEKFYKKFVIPSKIVVIGNPIRIQEEVNFSSRENIILSVGRLIDTKHHDELIKSFLKINKLDWKLIIVGGDALNQKQSINLQEIIKNNGAEERVILAGEKANVESYYNKSKIFAFTSSSEGFPNVIGEALSAGLAVISFDCVAGPSEMIINNKNGFLIELFNYNEFEIKLSQLMEDEKLRFRLGNEGRISIRKFDKGVVANLYLKFITRTL